MLKINEHTIISINQIALINLNSNYIYLNSETLKVTDEEMKLILEHIGFKEPSDEVVINSVESKDKKSSRATKKV
ncbi:MAG: hypothetical protein GX675_01300 [Erysipelotrichaceae bacterium]|nr:hypothetical protein [Erysipelotrichaceae bacterium]